MATAHTLPVYTRPSTPQPEPQGELAQWNRTRFQPRLPSQAAEAQLAESFPTQRLEAHFFEELRERVRDEAASVPRAPDDFVASFEALLPSGPGQGDLLFPWLTQSATRVQLRCWHTPQASAPGPTLQ